ncbi:hypothetical protein [Lapillicoccus sp.]|uniref:hypothetical protein n=1 Tax=Lapillicoccus sp. TaxID=1909287 RepID=UPI003265B957
MTRRTTCASAGLALTLACLAGCGSVDANRPGLELAVGYVPAHAEGHLHSDAETRA